MKIISYGRLQFALKAWKTQANKTIKTVNFCALYFKISVALIIFIDFQELVH